MMYSEKRCLEIYRVAREKNLFYAAHQRDHDSYELVLDYLLRQCDRFSLEIDVIYKNNQKTNWNEPQISAKLSPYFLEKRCVETESAWTRKNNSITTQFKEGIRKFPQHRRSAGHLFLHKRKDDSPHNFS